MGRSFREDEFEVIDALTEGLNSPRKEKKDKKPVDRVKYPFYKLVDYKGGTLVMMVERGGKNNPNGKRSYCDRERFFMNSKVPLTPMKKERAKVMMDEFVREDYLAKKAFNFNSGSNDNF